MTKQYLKPLALGVSLALALSACGKSDDNAAPAPAASSTAAPAAARTAAPAAAGTAPAAASSSAQTSVFDTNDLDKTINACQDFNGFVNAKWVAANPIPNDHTTWGAFNQLAEQSLAVQHDIVENAAKNAATEQAGSIEQKIGNLYKSGMDQDARNKAGFDPIKPKLDEIAAL
jgi:putative endopeptidase